MLEFHCKVMAGASWEMDKNLVFSRSVLTYPLLEYRLLSYSGTTAARPLLGPHFAAVES